VDLIRNYDDDDDDDYYYYYYRYYYYYNKSMCNTLQTVKELQTFQQRISYLLLTEIQISYCEFIRFQFMGNENYICKPELHELKTTENKKR
jgi:hypothetical protein